MNQKLTSRLANYMQEVETLLSAVNSKPAVPPNPFVHEGNPAETLAAVRDVIDALSRLAETEEEGSAPYRRSGVKLIADACQSAIRYSTDYLLADPNADKKLISGLSDLSLRRAQDRRRIELQDQGRSLNFDDDEEDDEDDELDELGD